MGSEGRHPLHSDPLFLGLIRALETDVLRTYRNKQARKLMELEEEGELEEEDEDRRRAAVMAMDEELMRRRSDG